MTSRALQSVDWMLDKTVVLGYTNLGFELRKHWWATDPPPHALAGKHVLITGATSGIGKTAARRLAELGAVIHLLGHDQGHIDHALADLRSALPVAEFVPERCDISDLDSVRRFADDFARRVPELHALIHNAGTMAHQRTLTSDGHEQTLATHVLGPFLLTHLLRESLAQDDDPRVIFMSSGGMYGATLRDDDPEYEEDDYSGVKAYARTKRMQVSLVKELAKRLQADRIGVHSMHPGWVETRGVRRYLPKFRTLTRPFMRSAAQGADTLVWLTATPGSQLGSGCFWHDRHTRPTTYAGKSADDQQRRDRLWAYCATATGVGH